MGHLRQRRGDAYYALGQNEKANEDYAEATRIFQGEQCKWIKQVTDSISKCPDAENYERRGDEYLMAGREQEAIEDYIKAISEYSSRIELAPLSPETFIKRGDLYHFRLRQHEKAIEDYTTAINLNPLEAGCYLLRGFVRKKVQHQIGVKTVPHELYASIYGFDHQSLFLSRGDSYLEMARYLEAIEDYTKIIESPRLQTCNGETSQALKGRGDAYRGQGQYQKAIVDYIKAIILSRGYHKGSIDRIQPEWLEETYLHLADAYRLRDQNQNRKSSAASVTQRH